MKRKVYELTLSMVVGLIRLFARSVPIKQSDDVLIELRKRLEIRQSVRFDGRRQLSFGADSADSLFRIRTFHSKEPETLSWIDGFGNQEVFWDIGANIGIYALYAGLRKIQTYAFEPSAANFYALNMNILKNALGNSVKALNVAFSDQSHFGFLNMGDVEFGGAANQLGSEASSFTYSGISQMKIRHNQGVLVLRIDDAIEKFGIPSPQHLKIDVDGLEHLIIKGADNLLGRESLKSLLIEINEREPSNLALVEDLKKFGYVPQRYSATDRNFDYIVNYIFRR